MLGARANVSYVKGIHNIKVGITYEDTILTEKDSFGIVDPTFNAVCLNADGSPDTIRRCRSRQLRRTRYSRIRPSSAAGCYDLTRTAAARLGAGLPAGAIDSGHADIRELALFCPGHHHDQELDLQSGPALRSLRRHHHRQPSRAAPRHRVQHQADQHACCGFPTPARWRRRSTKTWCWPATDATTR